MSDHPHRQAWMLGDPNTHPPVYPSSQSDNQSSNHSSHHHHNHEIGGIWSTTRHDQPIEQTISQALKASHRHVHPIDTSLTNHATIPAHNEESINISFLSSPSPSPDSSKSWRDRMREKREGVNPSNIQSTNLTEPPSQRRSQSHSINQSTRFAGLSIEPIAEHKDNESTDQTNNQSMHQPVVVNNHQPVSQTLVQPTNQSTDQPVTQSANQPINKADYQKELNRLTARALKAKLSKRMDQHEQLNKEIEQWKQTHEQSIKLGSQLNDQSLSQSSSKPPNQSNLPNSQTSNPSNTLIKASLNQVVTQLSNQPHIHDNVVILDQLDQHGRPFHYSLNQPNSQSNKNSNQSHKRRRPTSKLDANGQRLGYLEADLFDRFDMTTTQSNDQPHNQSTNQSNHLAISQSLNQSLKRDLINERLSNQSIDQVYVKNLLKKPKRAINQSVKQSVDQDEYFDALDDDLGFYEDKSSQPNDQSIKQSQIRSTERFNRLVDHCPYCLNSRASKQVINHSSNQSSVIATGQFWYLALPSVHESINQTNKQFPHLILATVDHCSSQSSIDQSINQSELNEWKQKLITIFSQPIHSSTHQSNTQASQPVFVESFIDVDRDHCRIDCLVIPRDMIAEAPLFFTQSLSQLMDEMTDGEPRKLIGIKPVRSIDQSTNQSISQLILPHFPYVSVEFGNTGGFIQPIGETVSKFPRQFRQEVVQEIIEQHNQSNNHTINRSNNQFDMTDKQLTHQEINQQRTELIADIRARLKKIEQ